MSGLAKTLRTAREKMTPRLSQSRVARILGMDTKTVGRWERAESVPELETLKRLADLYGLEWDPLLRLWSDAKLGAPTLIRGTEELSAEASEALEELGAKAEALLPDQDAERTAAGPRRRRKRDGPARPGRAA